MPQSKRSEASQLDAPENAAKQVRFRRIVRRGGVGLLAIILLALVGFGAVTFWQRAAQAKEMAVRTEARRNGLIADRERFDERGVPLLQGPITKDGPTWGKSQWADIEWLENSWFLFGRDGAWETDPNTRRYALIRFRNKSGRTLYNVQAPIELYTENGYLRTDACTFGDTEDGRTRRKTCGPIPRNVIMFRALGFKADWMPRKGAAPSHSNSKTDRT